MTYLLHILFMLIIKMQIKLINTKMAGTYSNTARFYATKTTSFYFTYDFNNRNFSDIV